MAIWLNKMKVGDLARYGQLIGLVLYVNKAGGTLRAFCCGHGFRWFVTSECEVISESR